MLSIARTWYDKDVTLDPIKDEVVTVIGYGSQGRAQASNQKDSGLNVIVGLSPNTKNKHVYGEKGYWEN